MRSFRYSIVLTEVLIAVALVTTSILPITSYPFRIYQRELSALKKTEVNRLYETVFFDLTQQLGTLITIEQFQNEPIPISLGEYKIDLDSLGMYKYKASCVISKLLPKEVEENTTQLLLNCAISLIDSKEKQTASFNLHVSKTENKQTTIEI